MKTMKKGDDIVRVTEKKQFDFLKRGYIYVAKKLWKENENNINKPNVTVSSKNTDNVIDQGKSNTKKKTKLKK